MPKQHKGSYEDINYSIRPAKAVERRILSDAFQRLSVFGEVAAYRYVGFGSTYFSDFILFHRSLGIRNMVSIEKDIHNQARFRLNKPFNCIQLEFGHSNEVLPRLRWDVRTILWLDYDGSLDDSVLADVRHFCASATSGSFLVVTVNAHPPTLDNIPDEEKAAKRVELLRKAIEILPSDIEARDLRRWGTAKLYRDVIVNKIKEILNARNGSASPGSRLEFQQIFNFVYQDGAKMLTIGGILFDEGQAGLIGSSRLATFEMSRTDDSQFEIEVPSLTYREIRYLDSTLPYEGESPDGSNVQGIPAEDVRKYSRLYRYFPTFAQTEL